jgi:hypothetical protein
VKDRRRQMQRPVERELEVEIAYEPDPQVERRLAELLFEMLDARRRSGGRST